MINVLHRIKLCIFKAFGKWQDNIMVHLENKAGPTEYIMDRSYPLHMKDKFSWKINTR